MFALEELDENIEMSESLLLRGVDVAAHGAERLGSGDRPEATAYSRLSCRFRGSPESPLSATRRIPSTFELLESPKRQIGNGVRTGRLWKRLLGVESGVVEEVFLEGEGAFTVFVARVRPSSSERSRCGRCKKRSPLYDRGEGPRRWSTLDLGQNMAYLEAEVPRVTCSVHEVCTAHVPWARTSRDRQPTADPCFGVGRRTSFRHWRGPEDRDLHA
jgi:hypothetical protein